MSYPFPSDIEQLIDEQMASGNYGSTNDVLLHALRALKDFNDSVADIQEGIDDEAAGRVRPFHEVDAEIRQDLGFAN